MRQMHGGTTAADIIGVGGCHCSGGQEEPEMMMVNSDSILSR